MLRKSILNTYDQGLGKSKPTRVSQIKSANNNGLILGKVIWINQAYWFVKVSYLLLIITICPEVRHFFCLSIIILELCTFLSSIDFVIFLFVNHQFTTVYNFVHYRFWVFLFVNHQFTTVYIFVLYRFRIFCLSIINLLLCTLLSSIDFEFFLFVNHQFTTVYTFVLYRLAPSAH